jgi:hypothetical protein
MISEGGSAAPRAMLIFMRPADRDVLASSKGLLDPPFAVTVELTVDFGSGA